MQAKVAIHSPRIKYSHRQNLLLKAENNSIKQKLSAFSGELMFKEGTLSLSLSLSLSSLTQDRRKMRK
jgi:hypothetical protein